MTTVLLIIQLMISIVLIGLILIQRSEGGALGIGGGGGGGGGGFMSGRSSTTAVIKATTILGTLFIVNCLALSIFFSIENKGRSALDGDNSAEGLIQEADSPKDTIPLVDDSVEPSETEDTPTDEEPTEPQ